MKRDVKNWKLIPGIILLLALVSVACGLSANIPGLANADSEAVPTRTPMPTFTSTPPLEGLITLEEPTPTPTAPVEAGGEGDGGQPTPEPTQENEEPTATPEPAPEVETSPTDPPPSPARLPVSATANVNVRGGPGTNYPVIGVASAGQSSEVVGRNQDATWLQVIYPDSPDGRGWVSAAYLQVNGDATAAPVVQADPPPVAANPPASEPPPANNPPPGPPPCEQQYQFCPAGWFTDHNEALVHFRGVIKNTGGGGVNGFSVRISNGSLSLLSFPSGPSSAAPDWHDGKWDIALNAPPIQQYFGIWTVQVVRYECPDFFNALCGQFVPLSEAIPIDIEPGAEVIVADWICHRDCDQGVRR